MATKKLSIALKELPVAEMQSAKIGSTPDFSEFESDGSLLARGDASMYDDYEFPIVNQRINPSTSRPDFNFATGDYLFDATTTETVIGGGHLPHSFKLGTPLLPHVHWKQAQNTKVAWRLEYKLWNNNAAEPASFTTLEVTTEAFPYLGVEITQISSFAAIDTSHITGVSANLKIRFSRVGANDTYVGDAVPYKVDFHFQRDSMGSRLPFIK